ncbi:MAG TPA: hypothetical protein VGQ53_00885 [Chitinophagaceae bacterium]|jgi:hypothetical protein|nr:hypothetical protein [Chitinophagaceae bacterium]
MKWKVLFGILFILSVALTFIYTNKSMVVYNKSAVEKVPSDGGGFFEERVTRTYHDNYAAIGGAIGFGIIAAASLLAFAIAAKSERTRS